ncbi:MAG: glycyl-radical enzyme activating protein [Planctomycetes bacterium]|nr:glycyl-radical enzyme activating protein [Planctomycetota bacterium]MBL7143538.1 glycyl-radical enzyme activating protein [Phycisphaerae bacterium]
MVDILNIPDSESSSAMFQSKGAELEIKGLVFDVKKYAIHDGPGIRTTVFFKGCPLKCQWCHNPESWRAYAEHGFRKGRCVGCLQCVEACPEQAISIIDNRPVTEINKCSLCGRCVDVCMACAREIIGREMTLGEIMAEIEQDVIFYDESGGGVTISGGEPLMQPEFLLAVLNQCQRQRIHTTVDTSCYAEPKIVEMVGERADMFLCDIKHMDSEIHERFTGVGNNPILNNIRLLSEAGKEIIVRIPIIPGFNDEKANIEATGKFTASLPGVIRVDILPFNRGGKEKSTRLKAQSKHLQVETPNEEQMNSIAKSLSKYGFEVKIGG